MILIAFHARVTDWKALQLAWRECCTTHRPRLARRMELYRNGHDASKALVLIEYPNDGAMGGTTAWQAALLHCLDMESIQEHMWEIIERDD